ncbi:LLM class flavin-dependent oxidoreductase [Lacicoccus alkaliphilus]|uniref:FMN-dependent oxidoreductase, nitrilotriacetate monooxygenase family n=1 Tax=Lacicoccus alkaliphilus DSM 16010 TaxID=1123231 RepID=A0A1M7GYT9_9BACL|nr:LLM class flavin-dependent oxidoreductase [Salinicoccus alkaliphilus]SHM21328.1 FMN-dependent oxidoreductase, nitrilotriacetate monooxygenase family [Salinicoccus alkaliphilus DSM 16010]
MKKQIRLNGFTLNSVAPHSPGLWRHPKDQGHRHGDLDYWTDLAQLLEKGKFDAMFLADVLGIYDVYGGEPDAAIKNAVQVPLHNPLLPISAMAAVTKHIGFAATYSATYTEPYKLARDFSTLDHLTKGRVAWNIVTSYLNSEAVNLGMEGQIKHDTRYDRADEYMDVVYKLWEHSWEEEAVEANKETGVYADPEKVHPINHEGEFFNVPGVQLVEPSSQRTPVLFQAGASEKGKAFAAKHAEALFTTLASNLEELKAFTSDVRARAVKNGRNAEDIKIFPGIVPIVGRTEKEAQEKYEELLTYVSYEGTAAMLSGHTGIDFSKYEPDQYVENVTTEASHGFLRKYAASTTRKWTVREAILHHGLGIGATKVIGTPGQVADELEAMANEGDADGFNIIQAASPSTFEDFIDHVIPVLQERGSYRTEYEASTLRENLFGKGKVRIPDSHHARKVRLTDKVHI